MNVLAIDPGTTMGWAWTVDGSEGQLVASGTLTLVGGRFESRGIKWMRLEAWLSAFVKDRPRPDLIAYEEVRYHAGTDAAHAYGGFVAILQGWCESEGLEYVGIPVGTVKKVATGRGGAKKPEMLEAAQKRWSTAVKTHDEADALWIGEAARQLYGRKALVAA